MRNKRAILIMSSAIICTLLIVSIVLLKSYYFSPQATAKRFVTAVENKNFSKAKKICPRYADDSDISEESYAILFKQMSESNDIKFLLDKSNFKNDTTSGLFSNVVFLPKKRYLTVTTENSSEEISVFQKNSEILSKDNKIGPLIPYKYTFDFEINHPTLGKIIKTETLSLDKDKELMLADTTTFLSSSSTQKKFMSSVSDFFISYNSCVQNNLDFSLLSSADEKLKEELNESTNAIKPFIDLYSLSFQTIVMNIDSLKIDNNQQMIYFDIFIDRKLSIQVKKELLESNNLLQEDSENAKVILSYSQGTKEWLVSEIDFETYEQNPENWKHSQEFKLKERNEAIWKSTESGNTI